MTKCGVGGWIMLHFAHFGRALGFLVRVPEANVGVLGSLGFHFDGSGDYLGALGGRWSP